MLCMCLVAIQISAAVLLRLPFELKRDHLDVAPRRGGNREQDGGLKRSPLTVLCP
jgi:hypothetical protein